MAIPGTIKTYIPNGISFTEDTNGYLKGFEWVKPNGNAFRVIFASEAMQLNLLDKTIYFNFIKEMKEDGEMEWVLKERYYFNGSEYINKNFGNSNFGKFMNSPFNADGSLKSNAQTFIDYYIDHIILGKNPPIALYITLLDIAANKENVTLI